MLAKLSELLFVEAIRRYADDLPEGQAGWLAGLQLALFMAACRHPESERERLAANMRQPFPYRSLPKLFQHTAEA